MRKIYTTLTVASLLGLALIAKASVTPSALPTAVGNYNAWTPSAGTTHFTLVDEAICNGNTDFVSTTVLNNKDSYSVSVASVPNGAVITGVAITPCASRNTNQTSGMAVFYRANGIDSANGASYALSGTNPANLAATNFSGLAITKNTSTTLEVGAVLLTGTGGAKLSRIATVVTYVAVPGAPFNVQNFVATGTPKQVIVSWANQTDTTGVTVEKSTDGVNFTVALATGTPITSYLDSPVTTGTYFYRVKASNVAGSSGYSSTTMAVVP
jgi:hypothetical protein